MLCYFFLILLFKFLFRSLIWIKLVKLYIWIIWCIKKIMIDALLLFFLLKKILYWYLKRILYWYRLYLYLFSFLGPKTFKILSIWMTSTSDAYTFSNNFNLIWFGILFNYILISIKRICTSSSINSSNIALTLKITLYILYFDIIISVSN